MDPNLQSYRKDGIYKDDEERQKIINQLLVSSDPKEVNENLKDFYNNESDLKARNDLHNIQIEKDQLQIQRIKDDNAHKKAMQYEELKLKRWQRYSFIFKQGVGNILLILLAFMAIYSAYFLNQVHLALFILIFTAIGFIKYQNK
ncbi:MAG: hypothetical protein WAT21_08215 [Saprospiraceae bacterium]